MHQLGICTLSIVPVRTEPSDKAELCTQLLFGDEYFVLEYSENNKWMKIHIVYDDYEGWIDIKQHTEVVAHQGFNHVIAAFNTMVTSGSITFPITIGSVLPELQQNTLQIANHKFHIETTQPLYSVHHTYADLQSVAQKYMHAPYLWGGKTPFGIDCSGFVQQVFKICGIKLPRDAYQQERVGKNVIFGEQKAGDLAFFVGESGRVIHVGLMIDSETIIHAHAYVRQDQLTQQGILNLSTNLYSHRLHSIKRMGP